MSTIRLEAVIRSNNESLLLNAALKHATRRGLTPGSYLDVRRTAPDAMVFDVETILEGALNEASCGLVSLAASITRDTATREPPMLGDVVMIDRR